MSNTLKRIVPFRHSRPFTGYGPTRARELIEQGKLPKLVPLPGGRALGFVEDELIECQRQWIAERDSGKAKTIKVGRLGAKRDQEAGS